MAASTRRPERKLLIGVGLCNGEPFMPEFVLKITRFGMHQTSRIGVLSCEIGRTPVML
jgi:hypothetical protein